MAAKSRLVALNCWPQAREMLFNNEPVSKVVHYIREVCGEYTDVQENTVTCVINNWIRHNKKKLARLPTTHAYMIREIEDDLNLVKAMQALFQIQFDLVVNNYQHAVTVEDISPKKAEATTKAVIVAKDLLVTISKLKLDHFKYRAQMASSPIGGGDTVNHGLERVKREFEEKYGNQAAAVALDPESRRRVFNAIHSVRSSSGKALRELIDRNDKLAAEHKTTIQSQVDEPRMPPEGDD